MREIVWTHVGQCGNLLSIPFWKSLILEHSDHNIPQESNFKNIAFNELNHNNNKNNNNDVNDNNKNGEKTFLVPRSIHIDHGQSSLDNVKASDIGHHFRPDNFISCGLPQSHSPFPDPELIDHSLDAIRQESEKCDALEGFHLFHSLGGYTGSFAGTLLLSKIREEYPDRISSSTSIFPSPRVSDVVVEPYNAILSLHQLIESVDFVNSIDNGRVFDLCSRAHSLPGYSNLNGLIARGMASATRILRFPFISENFQGNGPLSLRELSMFLVPFSRLHFISLSFPFNTFQGIFLLISLNSIVTPFLDPWLSLFDPCNSFSTSSKGKFLAAFANSSSEEIFDSRKNLELDRLGFVDWIPDNFKCFRFPPQVFDSESQGLPLLNGLLLSNDTGIRSLFSRLEDQFTKMFSRKAFLHWYIGEGFEEMEFTEALSNVRDLISEYQQYEECSSFPESHQILKNTVLKLHHQSTTGFVPADDSFFYDKEGNLSRGWENSKLYNQGGYPGTNIFGVQMDFFWKVKATRLPLASPFQLLPPEIISHIVDFAVPEDTEDPRDDF